MTVVDVELRDGSTVRVRPVRADDADALVAFLRELSPEARRYRFFGSVNLESAARAMAAGGGTDDHGLVALTGMPARVIGHAQCTRAPGGRVAEVAFAVADAFQGRGLGTLLLAHLAEHAHAHGVELLDAEVMADNRRMLGMFHDSGFPVLTHSEGGTRYVRFPASLSPAATAAFEARQRTAAAAMVRRILAPESVVVVGASRSRGTVGGEVLHHLRAGGYAGRLYAVNRSAGEVQGMPALARVADLPEPVDLAVVAVPASGVLDVARECGERGVRSLVVLSAGFAEVGDAGARAQDDLVEICRTTGMRLVGPNCLGVVNTAPDARLNATFAPTCRRAATSARLAERRPGDRAARARERARHRARPFVSVGNKADLSGNDLLQFWDRTRRPRSSCCTWSRSATRARSRGSRDGSRAPSRSWRSRAGAARRVRARPARTPARWSPAPTSTVDALFQQAGVIRPAR